MGTLARNGLTLSFPVPRWAVDNSALPSNNHISKTVSVNSAFTRTLFKEYSMSFLMVCRLIDFPLVVFKVLMFKVYVIIGVTKIEFSNTSDTNKVKQNEKKIKTIENLLNL